MKKVIVLTLLLGLVSVTSKAQDDLYFTPKKSSKVEPVEEKVQEKPVVYRGSERDVDEYNRRHLRSYYQKIGTDSLGNDVIEFEEGTEGAPDTIYVYGSYDDFDDFAYSRRMGYFDGFHGWYNPYFYSYWGWGRPYWRSYYWGWYDPWFDPWYDSWYGWYDPWYRGYYGYGYYGWGWLYRPYYHGGWGGWYPPYGGIAYRGGHTGTFNHGRPTVANRTGRTTTGTFGGARTGTFGSRSAATSSPNRVYRDGSTGGSNGRFGGTRSTGSSSRSSGTYSQPSRSSSSSSGSFGSSRSGGLGSGGSIGGGRSGGFGGSSVGGGSRSGGGFGGRR